MVSLITTSVFTADVPRPVSIDIDDLGWKEGWDLNESGGPYRLGLPEGRLMGLPDYEVLTYIGKAVGVRIKCLFIMSEFDRSNICAEYPTTTEQGSSWDNSERVSEDDFTIMDYVKDNSAHIEFGLHGVRHEFWDAETRKPTRAEWAFNQQKRPFDTLWGHMECFARLIDQYDIDFPRSVRTASANYYYNPDDPEDSGGLMNAWEVKYATLPPDREYLTNHGLMVLTREGGVAWDAASLAPDNYPETSYMTAHWTNFVDPDPALNRQAGDKWIKWFNMVKDDPERYVPRNTAQHYSQFLYRKYARITQDEQNLTIDTTNMPCWAYDLGLLGNLMVKHKLREGEHISQASLDQGEVASYYEDRGYAYIGLPKLDRGIHKLELVSGKSDMPAYVLNEGTYNVKDFRSSGKNAYLGIEMYGTQDIKVKLRFTPREVTSNNLDLEILDWQYDAPFITMSVRGRNIQGESGKIAIKGRINEISSEK